MILNQRFAVDMLGGVGGSKSQLGSLRANDCADASFFGLSVPLSAAAEFGIC